MSIIITEEEYRQFQALALAASDDFKWIEKYKESEDNAVFEFMKTAIIHLQNKDNAAYKTAADKFTRRPTFDTFRPKL
jgi:hypothetical protein